MGHRALVAYRRGDDPEDSTAEQADANPAGSRDDAPDASHADPSTGGDADAPASGDTDSSASEDADSATYDLHRSHWGGADFALLDHLSAEAPYAGDTRFAVDPEAVATDCSLAEVTADHLDYLHHEAFYRVGPDWEVTAYHVLWFGLEADAAAVERSETVGHGALVEAHPDDSDYLRGWFRGAKEVVGRMVDRDALTHEEAVAALADRVETWADDREVIVPE